MFFFSFVMLMSLNLKNQSLVLGSSFDLFLTKLQSRELNHCSVKCKFVLHNHGLINYTDTKAFVGFSSKLTCMKIFQY